MSSLLLNQLLNSLRLEEFLARERENDMYNTLREALTDAVSVHGLTNDMLRSALAHHGLVISWADERKTRKVKVRS